MAVLQLLSVLDGILRKVYGIMHVKQFREDHHWSKGGC